MLANTKSGWLTLVKNDLTAIPVFNDWLQEYSDNTLSEYTKVFLGCSHIFFHAYPQWKSIHITCLDDTHIAHMMIMGDVFGCVVDKFGDTKENIVKRFHVPNLRHA